ncbi:MAG TPA: RNA 3'-phosphate cyclase [Bacteroidetes bacterium]|nr:RNA 3'-phosphate cyclase [Bacteroidota bacterium]
MIEIDGAQGEGGGQILRSALALSILTRRPFRIVNIRARRANPGLQAQHLKAVEAAARIARAEVEGAALRSTRLVFTPRGKEPGNYIFDIGTAGSTLLVVQTVYLPLAAVRGRSTVTAIGGTHVPWSPCFHYLKWTWCPFLAEMGFQCDLRMERAGFYPKGGGKVVFEEDGIERIRPLVLKQRGDLVKLWGYSAVARLPLSIAERQRSQALRRLEALGFAAEIRVDELRAISPGTVIVLVAEFENTRAAYVGLGAKGKPAERVADEAVDGLLRFLNSGGTVDEFQADQLLLPLAIAEGPSFYRTPRVTNHLLTNAEVVRRFLPAEIQVTGELGSEGDVIIRPKSTLRDYL